MPDNRPGVPRGDPLRLAAVLLYARHHAAGAYAEDRRRQALNAANATAAEYWSLVAEALLTMIPVENSCRDHPH